ncbi:MAG TPA: polysaccharide biosynthesis/export family protein [Candidatus Baltobacteraceae bacterium]|jgi:protein involved in polysaccharide export with SLBB domain|nr:polysaccharide biosynthesis/export family protein [Candidatus Baltobacteraceae bacterium]
MKLIQPAKQILVRRVRATAFIGLACALIGLNAAAQASEPPSSVTQTNSVASAPKSTAVTGAATITSAPAAATNLSQTVTTNPAFILDDTHKLAIGDRLSFRILEDEDEKGYDPREVVNPFVVTDSGDLEVPYIGRVHAEDKTCRQLAGEIKAALEKDYYYHATVVIAVDVMAKSHGRVYLVGAVRLPGPVELPTDEVLTLSKAILRAGSFTDYADKRHVKVTRKDSTGKEDKKTFIVDVGEIFDEGKIETDLVLEPGDLVCVPDRLIRF